MIYNDWNEVDIDASLDLRTTVPDLQQRVARFQQLSESLAARKSFARIDYGPSPDEYYLESNSESSTTDDITTVFIHGGYWRAYTADDFLFVGEPWLRNGAKFISVNYALCPQVTLSKLAHQVACALSVITARGSGIRIRLVGHSAGAHLAMLNCCPDWLRENGSRTNPIVEAVLISGLYDLEIVKRSFLQETIRMTGKDVTTLSPMRREPRKDVRYQILVGSNETPLYKLQSNELFAKIFGDGAGVTYNEVADADHFSILNSYDSNIS